jgi:hypothetical protein
MAHRVIVIFRQQWLEISPRMDSAVQVSEDVPAAPWEDHLVLQGTLLSYLKR